MLRSRKARAGGDEHYFREGGDGLRRGFEALFGISPRSVVRGLFGLSCIISACLGLPKVASAQTTCPAHLELGPNHPLQPHGVGVAEASASGDHHVEHTVPPNPNNLSVYERRGVLSSCSGTCDNPGGNGIKFANIRHFLRLVITDPRYGPPPLLPLAVRIEADASASGQAWSDGGYFQAVATLQTTNNSSVVSVDAQRNPGSKSGSVINYFGDPVNGLYYTLGAAAGGSYPGEGGSASASMSVRLTFLDFPDCLPQSVPRLTIQPTANVQPTADPDEVRVFPEKATPGAVAALKTVSVRVDSTCPTVRVRRFDVDDPSSDAIVDPTGIDGGD